MPPLGWRKHVEPSGPPAISESVLHRRCVKRFDQDHPDLPRLGFGGQVFGGRARFFGALQKMFGYRKGWPDFFVAARGGRGQPGLFIEFKSLTGKQTVEQIQVAEMLKMQGYAYRVVRTERAFQLALDEYFASQFVQPLMQPVIDLTTREHERVIDLC